MRGGGKGGYPKKEDRLTNNSNPDVHAPRRPDPEAAHRVPSPLHPRHPQPPQAPRPGRPPGRAHVPRDPAPQPQLPLQQAPCEVVSPDGRRPPHVAPPREPRLLPPQCLPGPVVDAPPLDRVGRVRRLRGGRRLRALDLEVPVPRGIFCARPGQVEKRSAKKKKKRGRKKQGKEKGKKTPYRNRNLGY